MVTPFGSGQPGFLDISAIVSKFQGASGAISKSRAQLQPDDPSPGQAISFLDVAKDVDAFQGKPYAYMGPVSCP